jgi:ankyrin repeat protein
MEQTLTARLLSAIHHGRKEQFRILLAMGANVNEVGGDMYGKAEHRMLPLHAAAKRGDASMCTLLLEAGADVDAADGEGQTALHAAAAGGFGQACAVLVVAGADVAKPDRLLKRPLHHAAIKGSVQVCEALLSAGASLHEVDNNEWAPLHEAAAGGHDELCRFLIKAGANVSNVSAAGDTPLHFAVENGHQSTCQLLIELGADSAFVPKDRWDAYTTPFQTAIEFGRLEIARHMIVHCNEDPRQVTLAGKTMEAIVKNSRRAQFLAMVTEVEIGRGLDSAPDEVPAFAASRSRSIAPI